MRPIPTATFHVTLSSGCRRHAAPLDLPMAQSYTPARNAQEEADGAVRWKQGQFDLGLLQGLWRRPD